MPAAQISHYLLKCRRAGSGPSGDPIPTIARQSLDNIRRARMIRSHIPFRRIWSMFITLLIVWSLISCQGQLAPVTPTPANRATPTVMSMLRDAPSTLAITPVPTAEAQTLELFDYD